MASYVRTQIYLEPSEHARLKREAAERGISLAEHIRRLLEEEPAGGHVGEEAPAYGDHPFAAIIGMFSSDPNGPWHKESPKEEALAAFEWVYEKRYRDAETEDDRAAR